MDTRKLVRKLIWWTALGVLVFVTGSLLGAFALHTYGAHRLEAARSDFDARWGHLTRIAPQPSIPDHENGARWLVAGGEAIVCSVEDRRFYGQLSDRSTAGWTDGELSRARSVLHEQQNALEILLRSGDFEWFNLGAAGSPATYDTIDFSSIVMGIRLLVLEARLAWSEGRTTDTLAALNAVGRSADGLLRTPIVMMTSVGSAAARWAAAAATPIVSDPAASDTTLRQLRETLPTHDPVLSAEVTLAVSIAEMADEGFDYIDESFDPSMGWSIPFWIFNRYLLEDLYLAQIIEGWGRYLEIGETPAARWSTDASHSNWVDPSWPTWLALTGDTTPNLLTATARGQAAATQLQQIAYALELRLAAPEGLGPDACDLVGESSPAALTGAPITCRFDADRCAIVIGVPGAEEALSFFVSPDNRAALIPVIDLPVGAGCEQAAQGRER